MVIRVARSCGHNDPDTKIHVDPDSQLRSGDGQNVGSSPALTDACDQCSHSG